MTEDQIRSDLRRLFDRLDGIGKDVGELKADFRVHMAEDDINKEKVRDLRFDMDELKRFKDRGLLLGILAFALSGGFGAGVAKVIGKFFD